MYGVMKIKKLFLVQQLLYLILLYQLLHECECVDVDVDVGVQHDIYYQHIY